MKYLCIAIAMLATPLHASSFYTAEPVKAPDHLTPLDYPPDDYDELINRLLCAGGILTFIERPSFTPESCLVVQEDIPQEVEQRHGGHWMVPDAEKKYFIVVRRAKQSLYHSMAGNNNEHRDQPVDIAESRREISLELAAAIQRAWVGMLLHTRYPHGSVLGLDGTTLQFSAWARGMGTLHGETWSPDMGLTAQLTALAHDLVDFTEKQSGDSADLLQRLQAFETRVSNSTKQ